MVHGDGNVRLYFWSRRARENLRPNTFREGYLSATGSSKKEVVKSYLKSVGITLYLDYDFKKDSVKFIMVKTTPDMIPNPFESTTSSV